MTLSKENALDKIIMAFGMRILIKALHYKEVGIEPDLEKWLEDFKKTEGYKNLEGYINDTQL